MKLEPEIEAAIINVAGDWSWKWAVAMKTPKKDASKMLKNTFKEAYIVLHEIIEQSIS
jgi:hypothetical protein